MQDDARQQFSELLERHRGIVLKVAFAYCAHPEDHADLAQEIATQLWRAFSGYDAERSFSTWMYGSASLRNRGSTASKLDLSSSPMMRLLPVAIRNAGGRGHR